jgi:hypothetical protein
MAAGAISSPGSHAWSTCAVQCYHRDCHLNRVITASPCKICTKPIGWDTRFYDQRTPEERLADEKLEAGVTAGFVHADCAEDLAELSRSKGVTA